MIKLTPKQQMFVKEYLIDLNATQAAIRAGYSKKTANEQGARLLVNVSIATKIKEALEKRADKTELTAQYVLDGIKAIVERVKEKDELTGPALKAYELLGKHLGLFPTRTELSGPNGGPIETETKINWLPMPDDNG